MRIDKGFVSTYRSWEQSVHVTMRVRDPINTINNSEHTSARSSITTRPRGVVSAEMSKKTLGLAMLDRHRRESEPKIEIGRRGYTIFHNVMQKNSKKWLPGDLRGKQKS